MQVVFDPSVITYEELLDVFWASHDPSKGPWSSQYKAAIYYHDEEQMRIAEASRDALASRLASPVLTQILPAGEFFIAEAYHQKYHLQSDPQLAGVFHDMYPSQQDFIDSPAAAKVNGFLDGWGGAEVLEAMVDDLGLPERSQRYLWEVAAVNNRAGTLRRIVRQ